MRSAVILAVSCSLLAAVIIAELLFYPLKSTMTVAPQTDMISKGAPRSMALSRVAPRKSFDRVVQNNVFSPTRAPVVTPVIGSTVGQGNATTPDGLALKGVIITETGRSALIRTPRLNDYIEVHQGETVESWSVVRIDSDYVILRNRSGAEFRLEVWDSTPDARNRGQRPQPRPIKRR